MPVSRNSSSHSEKRLKAYQEAERLIKTEGYSGVRAAKQVGIPHTSLWGWMHNKKINKSKQVRKPRAVKSPTLTEIKVTQEESHKMVCLIGTPLEISNVIRGMK